MPNSRLLSPEIRRAFEDACNAQREAHVRRHNLFIALDKERLQREFDALAESSLLALVALIERESEDAKRLDWMEQQASKRAILVDWLDESHEEFALYEPANYADPSLGEDDASWRVLYNYFVGMKTLREALDAARLTEGPTE